MKGIVIDAGVVTAVIRIERESTWTPPGGSTYLTVADNIAVGPGWAYDGRDFTAPAPTQQEIDEKVERARISSILEAKHRVAVARLLGDPPDATALQTYKDAVTAGDVDATSGP